MVKEKIRIPTPPPTLTAAPPGRRLHKPVRFAILGTGAISAHFARACAMHNDATCGDEKAPLVEIVAVFSRKKETGELFKSEAIQHYGAAELVNAAVFTDLAEMLKLDTVDAVYVASPNSLHAGHCTLAIEAGKSVLCEKPACATHDELKGVIEAKERVNSKGQGAVVFMEAMRSVCTPAFLALREEVRKCLARKESIVHVTGAICQLSSRWVDYTDHVEQRKPMPNAFSVDFKSGCLMDFGCYAAYAAVALLGEPTSVAYTPAMLKHAKAIDGAGTLVLRYAPQLRTTHARPHSHETVCTFVLSKVSTGKGGLEVHTEQRTLAASGLMDFMEVTQRAESGAAQLLDRNDGCALRANGVQFDNIMRYEIGEFARRVRDEEYRTKTTSPVTDANSLLVARVLDEARASACEKSLAWPNGTLADACAMRRGGSIPKS
jgi:predicted dehydrogenase